MILIFITNGCEWMDNDNDVYNNNVSNNKLYSVHIKCQIIFGVQGV